MLRRTLNRLAQGISINVIIIAAIALIVLVILSVLVLRGGRNLGTNTGGESCLANAGTCRSYDDMLRAGQQYSQAPCLTGERLDMNLQCNTGACCVFNFQ